MDNATSVFWVAFFAMVPAGITAIAALIIAIRAALRTRRRERLIDELVGRLAARDQEVSALRLLLGERLSHPDNHNDH